MQEIAMNPSPAEFLGLYKAGLDSAVDLMKAALENAERLQQQQLTSLREAFEEHARNVDQLASARSIEDLVALQQKMAGSQLERVMGYWSSACQAAGQNQTEAVGRMQKQLAQAREWFNETYTLTARAAEEAATIAAAKTAAARPAERAPFPQAPPRPAPRRGSQGQPLHR
jgi:phasin family protein